MSTAIHDPASTSPDLGSLRAELDQIDGAIHALLIRRAETVAGVAALGVKGAVPLRPGREAAIIRRLLTHNAGQILPNLAIVRIWRELLAAMTQQQRPMLITVAETADTAGMTPLAREHFGAATPLRIRRSSAQAVSEVSAGLAGAAVLPMPADGEPDAAAWWTALMHRGDPRIHVVARLPFWAPRAEGAVDTQALVVCAAPPDPSGHDRSLLALELPAEVSRARLVTLMTTAGFTPGPTILRRRDPVMQALVEVDGFVRDDDVRLHTLPTLRPPVIVGAYAIPIGES